MNKGCHAESSGNVSDRETVWLASGLGCSEGSRQWCLFLHPTHPAAWCPAAWWLPSLGAGEEDVAEVSRCFHHHWKYPMLVAGLKLPCTRSQRRADHGPVARSALLCSWGDAAHLSAEVLLGCHDAWEKVFGAKVRQEKTLHSPTSLHFILC